MLPAGKAAEGCEARGESCLKERMPELATA